MHIKGKHLSGRSLDAPRRWRRSENNPEISDAISANGVPAVIEYLARMPSKETNDDLR
jgi:hypothetical protein